MLGDIVSTFEAFSKLKLLDGKVFCCGKSPPKNP